MAAVGVSQPPTLLALLVLCGVVYLIGQRLRDRGATLMGLSLCVPLTPLLLFKYFDAASWFRLPYYAHPDRRVPMGLSDFSFKKIHYLVESWRGTIPAHGLTSFVSYIFFWPMFQAGPIERFPDYHGQLEGIASFSPEKFLTGLERILPRPGQEVRPGRLAAAAADLVRLHSHRGDTAAALGPGALHWLGELLYQYFDFSGYTDVAIGTGLLFGIKLMENFSFPILRSNLAEYWKAWHISLSSWCRDYVYLPTMVRFRTPNLALLLSFLIMGVWHEYSPAYVIWGLHEGVGVIFSGMIQRWAARRTSAAVPSAAPACLGIVLVWWYQAMARAIVSIPGRTVTGVTFHGMFSAWAPYLRLYLRMITFGAVN